MAQHRSMNERIKDLIPLLKGKISKLGTSLQFTSDSNIKSVLEAWRNDLENILEGLDSSGSTMCRLIFIGAHCSGKTTRSKLAYEILKSLGFSVEYREEGIDQCPYPINEHGSFESQKWILDFYKERDLRDSNAEYVIMDRCSLDTIPYTRYLYTHDRVTAEEASVLYKYAWEIYNGISGKKIIFYNKPLPLVADNVRSTNEAYREFIAREFEALIRYIPDQIIVLE